MLLKRSCPAVSQIYVTVIVNIMSAILLSNKYLKTKVLVEDAKLLDVKVDSDGGLVIVAEDVVSEAVDQGCLADREVSDNNAFADSRALEGPFAVVSDEDIEPRLLVRTVEGVVGQRKD